MFGDVLAMGDRVTFFCTYADSWLCGGSLYILKGEHVPNYTCSSFDRPRKSVSCLVSFDSLGYLGFLFGILAL